MSWVRRPYLPTSKPSFDHCILEVSTATLVVIAVKPNVIVLNVSYRRHYEERLHYRRGWWPEHSHRWRQTRTSRQRQSGSCGTARYSLGRRRRSCSRRPRQRRARQRRRQAHSPAGPCLRSFDWGGLLRPGGGRRLAGTHNSIHLTELVAEMTQLNAEDQSRSAQPGWQTDVRDDRIHNRLIGHCLLQNCPRCSVWRCNGAHESGQLHGCLRAVQERDASTNCVSFLSNNNLPAIFILLLHVFEELLAIIILGFASISAAKKEVGSIERPVCSSRMLVLYWNIYEQCSRDSRLERSRSIFR